VSSAAEASLDPSSLWVSSGPTSREQAEREGCSRGVAGFEREVRTSGVVGGEGQLALTDDFARNRALRWERQVNAGKSKQGPKGGHTASHARSEGMGGVRAWEGGVRAWEGMGGVRAWEGGVRAWEGMGGVRAWEGMGGHGRSEGTGGVRAREE
jgi:hypothetical protein